MSNDSKGKPDYRILEFAERLYGSVADMPDDEVNDLYSTIAPEADAAEKVRDIASRVAQKYRLNNEEVPSHIKGALNATKTGIEGAPISALRQIVKQIISPTTGPVSQVSYAYRNKKELTDKDIEILDGCSREVQADWTEDKKE